jgi:5-methylcytosine-specific restriction endonuclease McrA
VTPDDIRFVINVLRQGTVKWPGRSEALRRARKKVLVRIGKRGQNIFKFHWQCASCREWSKNAKSVEVDHIEEIGPFNGNWDDYVRRVFCDQKNLQVLCSVCHSKKTLIYNSAASKYRRKNEMSGS